MAKDENDKKCQQQVEFGNGGGIKTCDDKPKPGAPEENCDYHDQVRRDGNR
ncbi:MAG TPA: hypothetical protein VGG54_22960 [Trebonia sp.]|jgi:hypothetical protein